MVVLYWLRTPFILSTSTVFFNFLIFFYYLLFLSVFFYVELGVLLPYLSGCVCLLWNLFPFQSVRVTVAVSLCLNTDVSVPRRVRLRYVFCVCAVVVPACVLTGHVVAAPQAHLESKAPALLGARGGSTRPLAGEAEAEAEA